MTKKPFIIPVFLPQEGCPHACVFCNQRAATGIRDPSPLEPEGVRAAVEEFSRHRGPGRERAEIAFYGGNFLGLPEERVRALLAAAALCVKEGLADGIRISTRPDTLIPARLDLLSGFPVRCIETGAQSLDDAVLAACGRGHSAADVERAAAEVKARGMALGIHLMAGLPAETRDSAGASARKTAELRPSFVRIHPTLVLLGSGLEALWRRGEYEALSLAEAVFRVRIMYETLAAAQIPVARMGLFSPEPGSVLAGPEHPAFGHLVMSAVFLEKARALLQSAGVKGGEAAFRVHPRDVSNLRGQANQNLRTLSGDFGLAGVRVIPDPALSPGELALSPA